MYTLIADIGSTKSLWTILNGINHKSYETIGFNPNYQSPEEIAKVFSSVNDHLNLERVSSCHLYGAGIDNKQSKFVLQTICSQYVKSGAGIHIENDLLAAARSCFSDSENGVIAILGTGSNIRPYEQGKLMGESKSLGFILGDEGGGVGFGKYLAKAYVYDELPKEINQVLKDLDITKTSIINAVYNAPYPQRYLANFARILYPYRNNQKVKALLVQNFTDFIESHVLKIENIQNKDLKFVGSMAYYFQDILIETAHKHHITIKGCYQNPMNGLIDYHKNNI